MKAKHNKYARKRRRRLGWFFVVLFAMLYRWVENNNIQHMRRKEVKYNVKSEVKDNPVGTLFLLLTLN
jgi:hypothetical protein